MRRKFVIAIMIAVALLCIMFPSTLATTDIDTDSYKISPASIESTLALGELQTGGFTITNKRDSQLKVEVVVPENTSDLILFDQSVLTIPPQTSREVNYTLFGRGNAGTYSDNIALVRDIKQFIPLKLSLVEVKNANAVGSLMIDVDLTDNSILTGDHLMFVVNMHNLMGETEYDVDLNYSIGKLNDGTGNLTNMTEPLMWYNETVRIQQGKSIPQKIEIPKNFTAGVYMLQIDANYLNYTSSVTTLFNADIVIYNKKLFGFLKLWIIFTVAMVGAIGFFVYKIVKKNIEKNKRFHAKIDYKLLPKEGERALWVGVIAETKIKAYLDMDTLTVHSIVAGSTGGGKSIAAQDIVEEVLLKQCSVVVFDPTAQWSGMLRKLEDKKFLALYQNFGLTPKDAKAFPGNIKAVKDGREIIELNKYLKPGEIQVFTTNTLDPKDYDMFVANTIRQVFHSNLQEYRGLKTMVVYDEIHRILPKFGGSGEGFIQIERGCREFRKWGLGILLISQVLQDFVGQIKANINTQIQMKTRDEGDLERIKTNFGDSYIHELIKSPVGSGMVQNANYNRGIPYYVTFRPIYHSVVRLTDDELDKYNKYNEIVDDLNYQLDQLEQEKQDVFDLRLELKLSLDKIKAGNFNMVQIYLDGITPRIDKLWKKIQKQPQKLQPKLVDTEALKKELEAAKASRAQAEATENAAKTAAAQLQTQNETKTQTDKYEKMDPEMLKANLDSINVLEKQALEAIRLKDWTRTNELIMEITNIPLPQKETPKKTTATDNIKNKLEEAKNPPKKPDKNQPQTGTPPTQGQTPGTPPAAGSASPAAGNVQTPPAPASA